MDSELNAAVEQLQTAIALVMDPMTPSHLRREASDVTMTIVTQKHLPLQILGNPAL